MSNERKKIILSGITATGKLTIANYIGAIKNIVKLQDEYESYVFIADLHALTLPIDPEQLKQNKRDIFALFMACGVDTNKTTLFFQSDVYEHSVMNWLITTQTSIGELSRMTQFKDKSAKVDAGNGTETIPTGLLMYPCLMAGDILLYDADLVPVGADQKQHLELTRNIAERLKNKYGIEYKVPEPYIAKIGARIMSLQDPTKKMSKSDKNSKASIYLLDDPEVAYKKVLKAVTDSENAIYASENKPGVTNLLTIYAALKNIEIEDAEKDFVGKNYGELKFAVGNEIKNLLIKIQNKYNEVQPIIDFEASKGAKKAQIIAAKNLEKIMKGLGLK